MTLDALMLFCGMFLFTVGFTALAVVCVLKSGLAVALGYWLHRFLCSVLDGKPPSR